MFGRSSLRIIRYYLLAGLVLLVPCSGVVFVVTAMAAAPLYYGAAAWATITACPHCTAVAQGHFSGTADAIASAAETLQEHLHGDLANLYDPNQDAFMKQVYHNWVQACGGTICAVAKSGSLQCVEFVTAAFAQANVSLPFAGNASDFWSNYQHVPEWQEIPVAGPEDQRQLPYPGDIVVWRGGQYGHVAVVIRVDWPHDGKDGSLTVGQANSEGNRWKDAHRADPGNWYTMTLRQDWSVVMNDHHLDGYQVQGYIRFLAS